MYCGRFWVQYLRKNGIKVVMTPNLGKCHITLFPKIDSKGFPVLQKTHILPLMGLFDFRDVNKRKKKRDGTVVACSATGIHLNGTPIEFPAQYTLLRDILGEASRIEPIKQTKNKVYLWDELGIYCASADPEKMLMLLLVQDNRYGLGHQPKKNFKGEVTIDGKPLADNIQNVGQDRPYMIRAIIKENQQVAIALGWNPGV